jgi:hypothetical protein
MRDIIDLIALAVAGAIAFVSLAYAGALVARQVFW